MKKKKKKEYLIPFVQPKDISGVISRFRRIDTLATHSVGVVHHTWYMVTYFVDILWT